MTKQEALQALKDYDGHTIMTVEFAQEIVDAFGYKLGNLIESANSLQQQGAYLNENKPGVAVHNLSAFIAAKHNNYKSRMSGRGSAHEDCCKHIIIEDEDE